MTIDESEIRRLTVQANELARAAWRAETDAEFVHACDAIRTALAAEREQHARDVADAEVRTWVNARRRVLNVREGVRNGGSRNTLASIAVDFFDQAARAQALNDSRNGEAADVKDAGVRATALPPPPPSGINQGSGAVEERDCERCGERLATERQIPQMPDWRYCSRCWDAFDDEVAKAYQIGRYAPPPSPASPTETLRAKQRRCIHGSWMCEACQWAAGYPREVLLLGRRTDYKPASPAGETRDEPTQARIVKLSDRASVTFTSDRAVIDGGRYQSDDSVELTAEEFHALLKSCVVAPASAPGGAPVVETACGSCKGRKLVLRTDQRPPNHYAKCPTCHGTGTTPTPSTETPTGGRG